jgi:hypothetical protein
VKLFPPTAAFFEPKIETGLPDGTLEQIPKMPILVNSGRPWNGQLWNIFRSFSTFIGHIRLLLELFGGHLVHFPPILVFCTNKNLATVVRNTSLEKDIQRFWIRTADAPFFSSITVC